MGQKRTSATVPVSAIKSPFKIILFSAIRPTTAKSQNTVTKVRNSLSRSSVISFIWWPFCFNRANLELGCPGGLSSALALCPGVLGNEAVLTAVHEG